VTGAAADMLKNPLPLTVSDSYNSELPAVW
jgi:hypothetical protein